MQWWPGSPCSLGSASWYTLTKSHWSCGTGCRKIRSPNGFKTGCFKQWLECGPPGAVIDSIWGVQLPPHPAACFAHLYGAMICAWTLSAVIPPWAKKNSNSSKFVHPWKNAFMSLFSPKKKKRHRRNLPGPWNQGCQNDCEKKKKHVNSPSFRIRLWKVPLSPLGDLLGMTFPTEFNEDYFINHEIRIPIKQPIFHGK